MKSFFVCNLTNKDTANSLNIENTNSEIKNGNFTNFKEVYRTTSENISRLDQLEREGLMKPEEVRNAKENLNKKLLKSVEEIHPYKISQGKGNDKRFFTYVKKEDGKRLCIRKNTKEEIINILIIHYGLDKICTLTSLYETWIDMYALEHRLTTQSTHRVTCIWAKYYKGTDIVKKDIHKITPEELWLWATCLIETHELTSKKYNDISHIMRQLYKHACFLQKLQINNFDLVEISHTIFERPKKELPEKQVFSNTERAKIEAKAREDFVESGNAFCLAINLAFYTGLRVGEMVALKSTDLNGNILRIHSQEVTQYEHYCNKTKRCIGRKQVVANYTKGGHDREILLTDDAKEIIEEIIASNKKNGYHDDDYLFLNENGRIHVRSLDSRIRKYCRQCKISEKSFNKIRKTAISTLMDSEEFTAPEIQEFAGHIYLSTTLTHYTKNRNYDKTNTKQRLNKALQLPKSL